MLRRLSVILFILVFAAFASAQEGEGNECTLAGTWYGGSVVSYQMTIVPSGPAGHYTIFAEGMYTNSAKSTTYTGTMVKKGNKYVGNMMQLSTSDTAFQGQPPYNHMPDIFAGLSNFELTDCNTLKNTITRFGIYFGANIWEPGTPNGGPIWKTGIGVKIPALDPPDVDLIDILNHGHATIIETYHRLQMP